MCTHDCLSYYCRQVEGRLYTTAKKFIRKYNLGVPLAGNFYLCSYDRRTDETFAAFDPLPLYVQNAFELAAAEREQQQKNPFAYYNKERSV